MSREQRRERMRRLLARREREGLTYRELAAISGESANTLAGWAWRLRHAQDFVELVSDDEAEADGADSAESLEIVLPNGMRVVASVGFDEGELKRVLRVAAQC